MHIRACVQMHSSFRSIVTRICDELSHRLTGDFHERQLTRFYGTPVTAEHIERICDTNTNERREFTPDRKAFRRAVAIPARYVHHIRISHRPGSLQQTCRTTSSLCEAIYQSPGDCLQSSAHSCRAQVHATKCKWKQTKPGKVYTDMSSLSSTHKETRSTTKQNSPGKAEKHKRKGKNKVLKKTMTRICLPPHCLNNEI